MLGSAVPSSSGSPLVQLEGVPQELNLVPSRFNARTVASDGTLVLYNSFSGAISGFPEGASKQVLSLLAKAGGLTVVTGIAKYLYERGYLVKRGTDELQRVRLRAGQNQYRSDRLDLILLSSEECNFRCVYCYETFPRGTMEPWVQQATIRLLENRAPRLKQFSTSYFGGEPLLGFSAIEKVAPRFQEICRENNIVFSAGMTTNGYLLTLDKFHQLVDWDVRSFQITIDGSPDHHDTHRVLKEGGGTSDVIIRNLLDMAKTTHNFRVAVRVNFDRSNKDSVPQLLNCLEPLKHDSRYMFRFYPIGKWGGPNDTTLETCGISAEADRQALDALAQELGFQSETRLPYIDPKGNLGICYAARPYNLLIGADGKIMKCTVALDTKDYNIIGRLTPEGRTDMDLDRFARWVTPYYEDDAVCRKCFYVPVCQGSSCPIPRIEAGERPCPPEKEKISLTLKSVWHAKASVGRKASLHEQA